MVLYCNECLDSLKLLDYDIRCFRCFSVKETTSCKYCSHFPLIYRRGALFEKSEEICAILREQKQKKVIASLFVLQMHRLRWPKFERIYSEARLRLVTDELYKLYGIKKESKGIMKSTENVLYLSAGDEVAKFPFSATCGKLFHLSLFLDV